MQRFRIRRNPYGMTTFDLDTPDIGLEIKLVSKLGVRERRAIIRSFFVQIRPWLKHFGTARIGHADRGYIGDRRAAVRGMKTFQGLPITAGGALGFEIRMRRLKLGLSQQELAEKAGIPRPNLSLIERGLRVPHQKTLDAIEGALSHAANGALS